VAVVKQIKIEIKGKDDFWGRAFHVEWEDQFPDRKLVSDGPSRFLARNEWLDDLERIANQTFCRVVPAPENPRRREWMSSILAGRGGS
jgi:hypothetical protein